MVGQVGAGRGRGQSGHVDVVLDRDGDAGQRHPRQVTAHEVVGGAAGALGVHELEGADAGVLGGDAGQAGVDRLARGEPAGAHLGGDVDRGGVRERLHAPDGRNPGGAGHRAITLAVRAPSPTLPRRARRRGAGA